MKILLVTFCSDDGNDIQLFYFDHNEQDVLL